MIVKRAYNPLPPHNRPQTRLPSAEKLLFLSRMDMFAHVSVEDYAYMLWQCANEKTCVHALALQILLHNSGMENVPLLGNHLVILLVDVSMLDAAQQVFDKLLIHYDRTCHALIVGYARNGKPYQALTLLRRLQSDETICLSGPVSVALLRACAATKEVALGNEVHGEIARIGLLDTDVFVGSALIDMYAKWCMLAKACQVFEKLSVRNVVTWNTMMSAYANHGYGQEALHCFDQMRHERISPDPVTFVCGLKACAEVDAIDKGQEILDEVERQGLLKRDPVVACAVIEFYIKDGSLARAQEVFDKLLSRDLVTWTALLGGYAEQGGDLKILECLEQMQLECLVFDDAAIVCMLQACGAIRAIDKGRQLHAKFESLGLFQNKLTANNALIDMYIKCGFICFAQDAFDRLMTRDVVSWNSLILGYLAYGHAEDVLQLFELMQLEKVSPSIITYVCTLNACARLRALKQGQEIHSELQKKDLDRDPLAGNSLIDMYAKCGMLVKAHAIFKKLSKRNEASWTALIAGYAENGYGTDALICFMQMVQEGVHPDVVTYACSLKACGILGARCKAEEMHAEIQKSESLERDVAVSSRLIDMYVKCGLLSKAHELLGSMPFRNACLWTTLIAGYTEEGQGEEALKCFEQMSSEAITPDDIAYICGLRACGSLGATKKGRELHAEIARRELIERDPAVGSALVDMYAKCGSVVSAQQVFDKLSVQDVASWNFLIAGHSQIGNSGSVFTLFQEMLLKGRVPDSITFMNVLNACKYVGLSHETFIYLDIMTKEFGQNPASNHQACMIDILCRTGHFGEALTMIRRMPSYLDLGIWHVVLDACRVSGNTNLGKEAFRYAVHVDREHAAAYITMSHINIGDVT